MELWQALALGLVEGLTEYLPVSSTGHLLVTQRLLGIPASEAANAYAIVIQLGAIVAVLGLYRARVAQMIRGVLGRDAVGARLALALAVAFLPAAVFGLAFDDAIEEHLFGLWPVIGAWALGGIVILVVSPRIDRHRDRDPSLPPPDPERKRLGGDLTDLKSRAALIIGLMQCLALWPGFSRSLAAILGGLLVGLSLAAAVEFAFLLGLVTLGAATAYKLLDSHEALTAAYGPLELGAGFLVAWLSAVVAVRWMVAWLNRRGLSIFGWWRLGAAALVATLLLTGALPGP